MVCYEEAFGFYEDVVNLKRVIDVIVTNYNCSSYITVTEHNVCLW